MTNQAIHEGGHPADLRRRLIKACQREAAYG